MSSKYEKQRQQQALIRKAFPDAGRSILTRPLVLDEKRKVMKENTKPGL